jgi:hypothetical protein
MLDFSKPSKPVEHIDGEGQCLDGVARHGDSGI